MKLRNKLLVTVLASTMTLSMPVITTAASKNNVVNVTKVEKDTKTCDPAMTIKFSDYTKDSAEEFFFKLENAEFLTKDDKDIVEKNFYIDGDNVFLSKDGTYRYTVQDKDTVKVDVISGADAPTIKFYFPIKAKGGDVKVSVSANGGKSTVTEGTYTILTIAEKKGLIAVSDSLNTLYDNGELTKMVLKETYLGSLDKTHYVKIQLDDTDFTFEQSKVKLKGKYGFSGTKETDLIIDKKDNSTAYVEVPAFNKSNSLGQIEITGIRIKSKEPVYGKVTADLALLDSINSKDNLLDKDYNSVALAEVLEDGYKINVSDVKSVNAGRQQEVEFEVKENADAFISGRTLTLSLADKDAYFIIDRNKPLSDLISDGKDKVKWVEVVDKDKDEEDAYSNKGVYRATEIKVTLKATDDRDSFKIKTKVYVPVSHKSGSVDVVGALRGYEDVSTELVKIVEPFVVSTKTSNVKVGLQNQDTAPIVLSETSKGNFHKGKIYLDFVEGSKNKKGITLEKFGNLSVEGDLKKADFEEFDPTTSAITLNRQSKTASTIVVNGVTVTVDRTVPEGYYDLELSGAAIDDFDGSLVIKKYITVTTKNTQDVGLAKHTVKFTVGEQKYNIDGKDVQMDAKAFIGDNSFIYAPVRYVADAFDAQLMYQNGTVVIFSSGRTISLTVGSNVAIVNGVQVPINAAPVIKNGRTYLPISSLSGLLGLTKDWNNETRTATFKS